MEARDEDVGVPPEHMAEDVDVQQSEGHRPSNPMATGPAGRRDPGAC